MKSGGLFLALLSSTSASQSGSPVEKVVELIQGVLDRTIADGEAEQQIYNKYACWCETTAKRKAAAIHQARMDMRRLGQTILKLKGRVAVLTSEIEQLGKDIAQNEKDQELATTLRNKENADWQADSEERKQALGAMQGAVKALMAGSSFVQVSQQTSHAVKQLLEVMPVAAASNLKQEHLSLLSEFASSGVNAHRYAPQSVTIQGILTDMYNTFAVDLEQATNDEATANRKFEDFIYEKTVQHNEATATKLKKEKKKAESEEQLADATQGYDDTEAQMEADIEFFDTTKEACEDKADEWKLRKKLRDAEVKGMKEALTILTSDEAREMFAKAIKPGKETMFLQVSSDTSAPAQHAYAVLKKQATKTHSLRLAQLAVSVKNSKSGHFDKVIADIDEIMQNLRDEEAADIKKRDECKDKFQEIGSTVGDLEWKIEKNEAKIDKLAKLIAEHQAEKAATIEEIESVETQMEAMTKQRKQENEAFKNAKKDDQAAIALLEAAKDAISKYYKENKIEMGEIQGSVKLLQKPFAVSEDQAPDATFTDSGSRKGETKGVISLMTMLIEDLQDEIKNDTKEEGATQEEYDKDMKAAKKLKEELVDKKVNLENAIADREEDKSDENADMSKNMGEKMDELEYKAKIKPDCDFVISTFDQRRTARAAEMNGLQTAKEYLAGAKVPSLLQKSKFNDDALANIKFMGMK
jgi:ribosomal protein S15P/S13E